ncbi:hypothetical protein HID58_046674, partial [Brassica napus]
KGNLSMEKKSMFIEQSFTDHKSGDMNKNFDDDGRQKRTGTWMTGSAHIITAVIGSECCHWRGQLHLGWVAGPAVLMAFSFILITFTSTMLADCYRSPDPVTGKRNYTYMEVVRSYLGGRKVMLCGLAQYGNLIGITIGYTITASISMRSNVSTRMDIMVKCSTSNTPFMIIFACIQIVLSQIPNFHNLSWLSILAAVMSFSYASIGIGLLHRQSGRWRCARKDGPDRSYVWRTFQAVGDIAFAYAYSTDTLKASPPSENKAMKRASLVGVSTTTFFYMLCGCVGYAAFGNNAPGNFLTGFGFYEPFWLIDFANVCIAVHLVGAYQRARVQNVGQIQVYYRRVQMNVPCGGDFGISLFRLVWRTSYVVVTAVVAMIFPFFNDFLGLIGAASFWPLTVYFPIEMHIAQKNMKKFSFTWTWLKILSWACFLVSLVAAAGSVQGLIQSLKDFKPFQAPE